MTNITKINKKDAANSSGLQIGDLVEHRLSKQQGIIVVDLEGNPWATDGDWGVKMLFGKDDVRYQIVYETEIQKRGQINVEET